MFYKYELENFKGFSDAQEIEIKPITLLYGPNSAGKSSLIKSLLLLKQSLNTKNSSKTALLPKGQLADIGSYQEMVNNHDVKKEIRFKKDINVSEENLLKRRFGNWINKIGYETSYYHDNNTINLKEINIYLNDSFTPNITLNEIDTDTYLESEKNSGMIKRRGNFDRENNKIFRITYLDLEEDGYNLYIEKKINRLNRFNLEINNNEKKITKDDIKELFKNTNYYVDKFTINGILYDKDFILDRNMRSLGIEELPMMIGFLIEKELDLLKYLGPLREFPVRHSTFSGVSPNDVGLHGENTGDYLFLNDNIIDEVNKWMKEFDIKYQIKIKRYYNNDISDLYSIRLYDEVNNVDVSPLDVGFGISQVLPVIVQAIIANGNTVCIEQPEIHLHPRLQTTLANLFVESVKKNINNCYIIETHSEHLMLRLQNLIKEKQISAKDISIIYVNRSEDGSYCLELRLNENGEFIDSWPGGFFEDGYREVFKSASSMFTSSIDLQ